MKQNAKRIKALGRKYAKQAFRLTENDFVDLGMLERAFLAGYKRCLKEVKEITNESGDTFTIPISEGSLRCLVSLLKDNLVPAVHEDIDRAAANKDYEALLEHLKPIEYNVWHYKKELQISKLGKQ